MNHGTDSRITSRITKGLGFALVLLALALPAGAGVEEGLAAIEAGDYEAAYGEFQPLAEAGDDRAMITIALWFHQGTGFPRDYGKAMGWYVKAFAKGNGDAYNNLGVLYRDGLGVEPNGSVAYALFLLVHLRGLGSEGAQHRANSNLRQVVEEIAEEERIAALCMTEEYLQALVVSRGTLDEPLAEHLPGGGRLRIRDDEALWLPSELEAMEFECPEPWG